MAFAPIKQKLPATRMNDAIAKFKEKFSFDPRGGGACFVAQGFVVEKLLMDLPSMVVRLHRMVVIGEADADIVFYWEDIPVRVRMRAKVERSDDGKWVGGVHLIPTRALIPSERADRATASALRVAAHKGELGNVCNVVAASPLVLPS